MALPGYAMVFIFLGLMDFSGPVQSLLRTLPISRPWIVSGLALVLMGTLADFGAVSIFNYNTFTTAIYKSCSAFSHLKLLRS